MFKSDPKTHHHPKSYFKLHENTEEIDEWEQNKLGVENSEDKTNNIFSVLSHSSELVVGSEIFTDQIVWKDLTKDEAEKEAFNNLKRALFSVQDEFLRSYISEISPCFEYVCLSPYFECDVERKCFLRLKSFSSIILQEDLKDLLQNYKFFEDEHERLRLLLSQSREKICITPQSHIFFKSL